MDNEFKITHSIKGKFKEKWDQHISDNNPFLKNFVLCFCLLCRERGMIGFKKEN